jgi:hypothetical protein
MRTIKGARAAHSAMPRATSWVFGLARCRSSSASTTAESAPVFCGNCEQLHPRMRHFAQPIVEILDGEIYPAPACSRSAPGVHRSHVGVPSAASAWPSSPLRAHYVGANVRPRQFPTAVRPCSTAGATQRRSPYGRWIVRWRSQMSAAATQVATTATSLRPRPEACATGLPEPTNLDAVNERRAAMRIAVVEQ